MSARMWMIGTIVAVTPWLTQAQDRTFDTPQRLDGVVLSVDFEPAAMAPGWADSHRSSGVDTAAPEVRPELDRHLGECQKSCVRAGCIDQSLNTNRSPNWIAS